MKVERLFFLVMAICLASGIKAQSRVYNSEPLFFHYYENTIDGLKTPITNPTASILIIRVRNGMLEKYANRHTGRENVETVVNNLKRNLNYYDNVEFETYSTSFKLEYDTTMSNAKWDVWNYFLNLRFSTPQTFYFTIKKDYTEFMEWREPDIRQEFEDERPFGRAIYIRLYKRTITKNYLWWTKRFLELI